MRDVNEMTITEGMTPMRSFYCLHISLPLHCSIFQFQIFLVKLLAMSCVNYAVIASFSFAQLVSVNACDWNRFRLSDCLYFQQAGAVLLSRFLFADSPLVCGIEAAGEIAVDGQRLITFSQLEFV